jgi:hypothetical protein
MDGRRWRGWLRREGAEVAGLALLLGLAWPDVLFLGRTLASSANVPSVHPAGIDAHPVPFGARSFIDPGASAWEGEPAFLMVRRAFASGALPHWNPGSACGTPLLGNQQAAPFYPPAALLHLLPARFRWDAFTFARLLLAGWLMLRFLAQFRLPRSAAFLGAAGFMLSGHFVLYANMPHLSVDLLHPAILWAVERLVRTGRAGLLAGVTAVAILGGMPESAFFVLTLGGAWFLFRVLGQGAGPGLSRARLFLLYAASSAAGLLLSAPVLLPFLEFLGRAITSHEVPTGTAAWPVATAITILDPLLAKFTSQRTLAPLQVDAARLAPHLGLALPFLALVGLRSGARFAPFCAGVVVLYLCKAYGLPGLNEVGRLPILDVLIFPKYFFPACAVAVAALAAAGAARLLAGAARPGTAPLALLALGAVLIGWRIASPGARIWPGLAILATVAAAAAAARRLPPRGQAALWIALVAGELLLYVPRRHPGRPALAEEPPFVTALRAEGADRPGEGRVLSGGGHLHPNWAAALGFEDPRYQDAIMVRRYHEFVRATLRPELLWFAWNEPNPTFDDATGRWMGFLNVRWLVSPRPLETNGSSPPPLEPVFTGGPLVYRNRAALPRAFVVHRAEVASHDAAGFERLRAPDFDPAVRVLLHEPVPESRLDGRGAPERDGSRARVVRHAPSEVVIEAELEHAGFLVVSEVDYPGWGAEVDGAPALHYRANHAFRAVWLDPGKHTVRFVYGARAFWLGAALAAGAALAWALFLRSPLGKPA